MRQIPREEAIAGNREMPSISLHVDPDDECPNVSTIQSVVCSQRWFNKDNSPNSSTASTTTPPPSDLFMPTGSPHGDRKQVAKIACCAQNGLGENVWADQEWLRSQHAQKQRRECGRDMYPQITHAGSGNVIAEMRRRSAGCCALATDVSATSALNVRGGQGHSWRPTLRHLRMEEALPPR